jgi:hypothetical protein
MIEMYVGWNHPANLFKRAACGFECLQNLWLTVLCAAVDHGEFIAILDQVTSAQVVAIQLDVDKVGAVAQVLVICWKYHSYYPKR